MSRSYKKNPYVTDHKRKVSKRAKRIANHSFRNKISQDDEMPARAQHKKVTESWLICDYRWRMTYEEAIQWYTYEASDNFKRAYPTLELWLNYWEKCHRRK